MEVKCPNCKKPTEYSAANAFRPFCSERCRLIDLGNWADETYAIPVKPAAHEDLTPYPVDDESDPSEEMRH